MTQHDLLIEIGLEELPAAQIETLSLQFSDLVTQRLAEAGFEPKTPELYATPRRLALLFPQLKGVQAPRHIEKRGPSLKAAFDDSGQAKAPALGFAASLDVSLDSLHQVTYQKDGYLYFRQEIPGVRLNDTLLALIESSLDKIVAPKKMSWGASSKAFIRPIRWVCIYYNNESFDGTVYGLHPIQHSYGHRYHHPEEVKFDHAHDYESQLLQAHVIASAATREARISRQLEQVLEPLGVHLRHDAGLLKEVCGLTEWPRVMLGQFDATFLSLPSELLVTSMRNHQRCFPLYDSQNQLTNRFAFVANIESSDPLCVVRGNEKVMHARLEDAAFYYEKDSKTALSHWQAQLEHVVFQKNLGSLGQKTARLSLLAQHFAPMFNLEVKFAQQAAQLCKTDLMSDIVGEFPELQGTMGRYYLVQHGEDQRIARAVEEHYQPRFSKDSVPATALGALLALVDRLDNLVGLFGLGKVPVNDKDPFALRRQAIAVVRILIAHQMHCELPDLIKRVQEAYSPILGPCEVHDTLMAFIAPRYRLFELETYPAALIDAVLAAGEKDFFDCHLRILAVHEFSQSAQAQALSASNKRVANILRKVKTEYNFDLEPGFEAKLLETPTEKELGDLVSELQGPVTDAARRRDYPSVLQQVTRLSTPLDAFFEHTLVMVDNQALRANRIKLLHQVRALFLTVADISLL